MDISAPAAASAFERRRRDDTPIVVDRWPTETPLFVLSALVAALLWIVLTVTVVGILYAGLLALFFGLMHLVFVGHVRGSAVKLGPDQFPELYEAVDRMARRMGLAPTPETYLMQAGGSLNAFATKFLRSQIVVLYSDLLVACGDSVAARDMIIAHELGHLKAGHLRWRWFLLPSGIIPFLGSALSRAREYTCDRYGLAGAGERDGATLGLTILAAGAEHGPLVNRSALVRQKETVTRSALMTLGEWFGSHPPLSKRIAQVDPSLAPESRNSRTGPARAAAAMLAIPLLLFVAGWWLAGSDVVASIKSFADSTSAAAQMRAGVEAEDPAPHVVPADAEERARTDLAGLAAFIEEELARGSLPWNMTELENRFSSRHPQLPLPNDPFDGSEYGYDQRGGHYLIWSTGPDQRSWTDDDIRWDSRVGRVLVAGERAR